MIGNSYIVRISDGKYLMDVRADGRVICTTWMRKAIPYPAHTLALAHHTLKSLNVPERKYQLMNPLGTKSDYPPLKC